MRPDCRKPSFEFKLNNSWKILKLKDLVEFSSGGTPSKSKEEYWGGEIPWISASSMDGYYYSDSSLKVTELGAQNGTRVAPKNSLLLLVRGSILHQKIQVGITTRELTFNQDVKCLVVNNDEIDSKFLLYWFKANEKQLLGKVENTGIGAGKLDTTVLRNLEVQIPPKQERAWLVQVFNAYTDKIELNRKMNETLEQMAQALFKSWFVDNCNENWEEKSLSTVATFTNGLACQKFPPLNDNEKLPVLKIKDLKSGISTNSDWVTSNVDEKYLVFNGDIIFSWSASLLVKLWDGEECVLNQHLFKVTSDYYPKWYLYLWCKHHLNRFISIAKAMATTMGHIKRKDLDGAIVFVPSNRELDEMTKKMKPLIDRMINNNKQIRALSIQRDVLLPQLISGKLRVKEVNK
jgi:type I restriction enzyme S subunit